MRLFSKTRMSASASKGEEGEKAATSTGGPGSRLPEVAALYAGDDYQFPVDQYCRGGSLLGKPVRPARKHDGADVEDDADLIATGDFRVLPPEAAAALPQEHAYEDLLPASGMSVLMAWEERAAVKLTLSGGRGRPAVRSAGCGLLAVPLGNEHVAFIDVGRAGRAFAVEKEDGDDGVPCGNLSQPCSGPLKEMQGPSRAGVVGIVHCPEVHSVAFFDGGALEPDAKATARDGTAVRVADLFAFCTRPGNSSNIYVYDLGAILERFEGAAANDDDPPDLTPLELPDEPILKLGRARAHTNSREDPTAFYYLEDVVGTVIDGEPHIVAANAAGHTTTVFNLAGVSVHEARFFGTDGGDIDSWPWAVAVDHERGHVLSVLQHRSSILTDVRTGRLVRQFRPNFYGRDSAHAAIDVHGNVIFHRGTGKEVFILSPEGQLMYRIQDLQTSLWAMLLDHAHRRLIFFTTEGLFVFQGASLVKAARAG